MRWYVSEERPRKEGLCRGEHALTHSRTHALTHSLTSEALQRARALTTACRRADPVDAAWGVCRSIERGRIAPFADRPDNKRRAAAPLARRADTRHVGAILRVDATAPRSEISDVGQQCLLAHAGGGIARSTKWTTSRVKPLPATSANCGPFAPCEAQRAPRAACTRTGDTGGLRRRDAPVAVAGLFVRVAAAQLHRPLRPGRGGGAGGGWLEGAARTGRSPGSPAGDRYRCSRSPCRRRR